MTDLKLFCAPVQGHTDHAYRMIHSEVYGPADAYFTPFIRVEKGELRRRDVADFTASREAGLPVVAQVIFRNADELNILLSGLTAAGADEIDLNMGCPFPLQTARGRGAATIGNRKLMEDVKRCVAAFPDVRFSMKIRLGMTSPDEWRETIDIINRLPLTHLTVHPRVARQQYGGTPDMDAFRSIFTEARVPVVYNGDLRTPADAADTDGAFPGLEGLMFGRGLLGRPSLLQEIREGEEMAPEERVERMMDFHSRLFDHYSALLCGESQVLSKIKPFWEYAEEEIGRKPWKAIRKAGTMPKYLSAVATI